LSNSFLRALSACLFAALTFSGCAEDAPPKIEAPIDWQAHLKPAKLAADFVPAVAERVYVPIYSDIYYEDSSRKLELVGTLSIRNTDATKSIILKSVRYYGTQGNLIESLLKQPLVLGPFATADVVVPRRNESGGTGANFVVDWMSEQKVSQPLIESVMVSIGSSQNLSFVSRGVVTEHTEKALSQVHQPQKTANP
jgi:Protein of unknown function (DUF3124)